MGREIKIGLAIIGGLLSVFGFIVYRKIAQQTPAAWAAAPLPVPVVAAPPDADQPSPLAKRSRISSLLNSSVPEPARYAPPVEEPQPEVAPPSETPTPLGDLYAAMNHSQHEAALSSQQPEASPVVETTETSVAVRVVSPEPIYEPTQQPAETPAELPAQPLPPAPEQPGLLPADHAELQPLEPAAAQQAQTPPWRTSGDRYRTEEPVQMDRQVVPVNQTNDPDVYSADAYSSAPRPAQSAPSNNARPVPAVASNPQHAPATEGNLPYANGGGYRASGHTPGAEPKDMQGYPQSQNYTNGAQPGGRPLVNVPPVHVPHQDGKAGTRHNDKYLVQPNDSYWVISTKLYGTGAYFKALYEHNKHRFPFADRLQVGDEITAPEVTMLQQHYPDLCPRSSRPPVEQVVRAASHSTPPAGGRVYFVQQGDTLYDVARYELGKASRWVEIYQLNQAALGRDFNYLPPVTRLILPPTASPHTGPYQADPERITTRPVNR